MKNYIVVDGERYNKERLRLIPGSDRRVEVASVKYSPGGNRSHRVGIFRTGVWVTPPVYGYAVIVRYYSHWERRDGGKEGEFYEKADDYGIASLAAEFESDELFELVPERNCLR